MWSHEKVDSKVSTQPWLQHIFWLQEESEEEVFKFSEELWRRGCFHLNGKKSMESQTREKSWYWKQKTTLRKDLITYDSHPWIMFSFIWLVIIWRWRVVHLKLDVQSQGGGRILDVAGQARWGSWKLDNFHGHDMCIVPYIELFKSPSKTKLKI